MNILDIKIGGRSEKPNKITESVKRYKIKLNGMRKNNYADKDWFLSKYILNEISDKDEILKNLAYFFHIDDKIEAVILDNIINKLK